MQSTADYTCAFCGETSTTFIDISAGLTQTYIEDCQVCCRPNQLYIAIDDISLDIEIATDYLE
ncbi:CPXCG motif-containing cysteine-rich protein [Nodosilinea sp. E11]|uniref:CPXCG motif-containing cysteine-rich protein n=1 Tax=Nodosilinea sp. E11 TaxID=3037479 RepID=UPI0029347F2A|nr:CPXCG motif-containing cysteine-rich protein [Nodosilinea sp. E11]WOD40694.1 CPXCG motif-containing cysteine-rich protein [Nodosilinea sp. E11]